MEVLEKRGNRIEKALRKYAEGNAVVKRELEKQLEKYENVMYNFITSVEPEDNNSNISQDEVFVVNPPRQEDPVKHLGRLDQVAALSAAYYSGQTGKPLDFLPEGEIRQAATYFRDEDWSDTFEGRGAYTATQDVIFLKKLPEENIDFSNTPPVFRPLAELLGKNNSNRTLEGLLIHESTHAYINRKTRYHEKLSGQKEKKAASIDEAAAHVAESLYNSSVPPTQSYQAKNGLSKEYLHTASEIIRERLDPDNTTEAVSQIREMAIEMIQKISRDEKITSGPSENYGKAVKAFEDAEKKVHPVLKFYGVIDEVEHELENYRPGHFNELIEEFNHELETGFNPHQRMAGLEEHDEDPEDPREIPEALEEMKQGLGDMIDYAQEQEKQEFIPVAQDIQNLLAYLHEEDHVLGQELHEFYFSRGKTSPEYINKDMPKDRRKALKQVLERYRKQILEEALEVSQQVEELLQDVFQHEEKLEQIEQQLQDRQEYQKTVELVKFTRDISKTNSQSKQRLENAIKELKAAEKQL